MRLQYVISVVNPTDEPLYIQFNTYYKQVLFSFAKLALEATILLLPNMAAVFVCTYILYNMMMSYEKTVEQEVTRLKFTNHQLSKSQK